MQGRRITRSRTDRFMGGVAGGLGEYLGVDPLFVRLAFVLLGLANGLGALLYIVLWLIVPNEGTIVTNPGGRVQESLNEMQAVAEQAVERVRTMFR